MTSEVEHWTSRRLGQVSTLFNLACTDGNWEVRLYILVKLERMALIMTCQWYKSPSHSQWQSKAPSPSCGGTDADAGVVGPHMPHIPLRSTSNLNGTKPDIFV